LKYSHLCPFVLICNLIFYLLFVKINAVIFDVNLGD